MKRILIDIVDIIREPLENAYLSYDENNIYEIFLMIVGNQNTPYEGGFYTFKINFTEKYPIEPPKVRFLTTVDRVRVNPNLYDNGKVCLSILGTWSGPSWTSAMTLKSLILSLQSLLNETPIRNEPGYESESESSLRSVSYNKIISYFNWYYAIIEMLRNPLHKGFHEKILEIYKNNYEQYKANLELKQKDEAVVVRSMYGMKVLVNYAKLKLPLLSEITCPMNSS